MTDTYLSYTRDAHLVNFDYKKDLHNCAVERDRVFITKKLREDSEESDENRATSKKTTKSKLKGVKKLAAKPKGKQPIKRLS